MGTSGFLERLSGALLQVEHPGRVALPERGPTCGEGLLAASRAVYEQGAWVHRREGRRFDVRGLRAVVQDTSPLGFRAEIVGGVVEGIAERPLAVLDGFADLHHDGAGHRLYYRLAVLQAEDAFVLEGVKEFRLGMRRTWWEARSLFARVVRLDPVDALVLRGVGDSPTAAPRALDRPLIGAIPVAVGMLKVRELVRRSVHAGRRHL